MTAPGYCWIFGAPYRLQIQDNAGVLYTTFAEAYDNTLINRHPDFADAVLNSQCASQEMAAAWGKSVGEMYAGSTNAEGYPSNLQPALAVAVDSGIPNSANAWEIFMNRSVKPDYNPSPQWAVVPRNYNSGSNPIQLPSAPTLPRITISR
jgi:hypothetical protein